MGYSPVDPYEGYLYNAAKQNARRRGYAFRFTATQWVAWWVEQLGPDWIGKRGRGRGKYVMARMGDLGAYEPGNVVCILYEQNASEQAGNIAWARRRKLRS